MSFDLPIYTNPIVSLDGTNYFYISENDFGVNTYRFNQLNRGSNYKLQCKITHLLTQKYLLQDVYTFTTPEPEIVDFSFEIFEHVYNSVKFKLLITWNHSDFIQTPVEIQYSLRLYETNTKQNLISITSESLNRITITPTYSPTNSLMSEHILQFDLDGDINSSYYRFFVCDVSLPNSPLKSFEMFFTIAFPPVVLRIAYNIKYYWPILFYFDINVTKLEFLEYKNYHESANSYFLILLRQMSYEWLPTTSNFIYLTIASRQTIASSDSIRVASYPYYYYELGVYMSDFNMTNKIIAQPRYSMAPNSFEMVNYWIENPVFDTAHFFIKFRFDMSKYPAPNRIPNAYYTAVWVTIIKFNDDAIVISQKFDKVDDVVYEGIFAILNPEFNMIYRFELLAFNDITWQNLNGIDSSITYAQHFWIERIQVDDRFFIGYRYVVHV